MEYFKGKLGVIFFLKTTVEERNGCFKAKQPEEKREILNV